MQAEEITYCSGNFAAISSYVVISSNTSEQGNY